MQGKRALQLNYSKHRPLLEDDLEGNLILLSFTLSISTNTTKTKSQKKRKFLTKLKVYLVL